jgi:tRNA A-37 threonylcarbamoyl transferase component Bud32
MAGANSDDRVERLVRQHVGHGFAVKGGPTWLTVWPDGSTLPGHGWKLHVSSRAPDLISLAETLLPLLTAEGCVFKLARSAQVLAELNDGRTAPASVGKAVTIYPDQRRVREFGLRLAQALSGRQGPRVLSDRRIAQDAPVYYRYGSFATTLSHDARGRPETRLYGPRGEEFDGLAGLRYQQPPWAPDPFTGEDAPAEDAPGCAAMLGGRYAVVSGLREAAAGNVYRALDTRDHGRPVIVKQARALVAEDGDRNDNRLRLRNERRILCVLDGVAGVPRFVDHFRHGDDEFLVTSDCGPANLAEGVDHHGPYQPGPETCERSLSRLAADLARILTTAHGRGVIVRDLSPANVVIAESGAVTIIDFGLGAYDGLHLDGRTPGYAPARQVRGEPPRDTDDLHSLGMTLLFAGTGLHPLTLDDDPDLPRIRALQAMAHDVGVAPAGIFSAIAGLLSGEDERIRESARQITSGGGHRPGRVMLLPAAPSATGERAAEVTESVLADVLGLLDDVLRAPDDTQAAHDVTIYSGSAGVGLELLHHRGRQAADDRIRELAAFTASVAEPGHDPGLFTGVTGADVFLQEALDAGVGADGWPGRALPPPGWKAKRPDLVDGNAGVGLGYLYFYRRTGDPADLEVARQCAWADFPDHPLGTDTAPGEADVAAGRAHGLAGTAELMLTLAQVTGDARAADQAAELLRALISEAALPCAEQRTVSWCRGLAGIGQTFLHASTVLGDMSFADLAGQAADACIARVPRLRTLGQCCGAVGVGSYLLDLATVQQSERYQDAAHAVAAHLLIRSAGPPGHPRFVTRDAPPDRSLSWAHGLAGLLSFFRRLARGGPDCLPAWLP